MIFTILFLLQWIGYTFSISSYGSVKPFSHNVAYSDAFLSGNMMSGSNMKHSYNKAYSDTFLSGAQSWSYFMSINTQLSHHYKYLSYVNSNSLLSKSIKHISSFTQTENMNSRLWSYISSVISRYKYISYINSNIPLSTSMNIYSMICSAPIPTFKPSFSPSPPTIRPTISPTPSHMLAPLSKSPSPSPIISSTQSPSTKPSFSPFSLPSKSPTTKPSVSPFSLPSKSPTTKPSVSPSPSLVPIISFDTKISFTNYNSPELDVQSQNAIIVATSNSMNISISFIKYIGAILQSRRRLIFFRIQGYNLLVSLQITIPVTGSFSPQTLYSSLTTKMAASVSLGNFTQFLKILSPSFANITILSVENDNYVVITPDTNKKSGEKTDIMSIIYVILFSVGVVAVIKAGYMIRKRIKQYFETYYFSNRQTHDQIFLNQI